MCRRIVVTSGKGGVGKTTFTASVGTALAELGNKVLLIDADIGLNNLDVLMGVESKVAYDMLDVIEGRCKIRQALIADELLPNLFIMPSAHAMNSDDIGAKNFRNLIMRLSESFDYLLIDCPAGIEKGFHRAVSAANEAVVVTTPHIGAIRDADKVLSIIKSYNLNATNIVVNRARGDLILKGDMMDARDICKLLKCPPIGVVPEDDNISIYSQLGRLGCNESLAGETYRVIADNLVTGARRIYDPTKKYKGMLGKLKLMLRSSAQ